MILISYFILLFFLPDPSPTTKKNHIDIYGKLVSWNMKLKFKMELKFKMAFFFLTNRNKRSSKLYHA